MYNPLVNGRSAADLRSEVAWLYRWVIRVARPGEWLLHKSSLRTWRQPRSLIIAV